MSSVDVLIIAALREEHRAARTAANGVRAEEWRERNVDPATPYLVGEFRTSAGDPIMVALARPTGMGGRRTGSLATTLTNELRPTVLAMCGVCAGNPDDTAHGDVIVAAPAYEYDEGKQFGDEFFGVHQQYPLDDRWVRAVQDFEPVGLPSHGAATEQEAVIWFLERLHKGQDTRNHPARPRYFPRGTWPARLAQMEAEGLIVRQKDGSTALTGAGIARIARILADDVDGPDRLPFTVEAGPMASGSAVIEDPHIWARLKKMGMRKILGLEMEGATIATVAHDRGVPHWLVAKGVMDNANFDKDDRFKEFAARASAEVLFALLGQLVPERPARRVHPTGTGAPFIGAVPGAAKLNITRRLHGDWQALADLVEVPGYEQARFPHGHEARALWEWLDVRGRLAELPSALDRIGRRDLGDLLRRRA